MPSIIRVLDDTTINQIAAGEVIENPASVIKELVENALDAEATSISIEVSGSGRHQIRVTDNGIGMNRDDALLCFERHATSKVYQIEDLDRLASMGFRGEALPSIASIAKVQMITKPRGSEKGTLIEIQGGKTLTCAEVPCDVGTSIEVTDLFYNVPARRKFLKSPKSDLLEIQKMVTEIAFGNTLVHFSLTSDGECILDVPLVSSHLERAKQLLNESIFENMLAFKFAEDGIRIEGLIGEPILHRPNRTGQSLFLNQRPVSSWEIAQAVLEGYGTSLPERRYPLFHIHLTMPPHEFDINVHPQKKEVRFCHLSRIKDVVRKGIMQGLTQSHKKVFEQPQVVPIAYNSTYEKKMTSYVREFPQVSYFEKEKPLPLPVLPIKPSLPKILAILPFHILLEDTEGMQAVDIQRARKRIIYENMLKGLKKQTAEKQLLLVPLIITLPIEESVCLEDHLNSFASVGFIITASSKTVFEIRSIPSFLKEEEVETLLHNMIKAILHEKKNALESELFDHIASAAVQHIARENKVLSHLEAEHLLQNLYGCQQPHFTSTGQSIVVKISWDEFGRFFK